MSTLTDEDRVVLEALDFDVPCYECGEMAAWGISVVCCGMTTTKCIGCFARWETLVAQRLGRVVECQQCKHAGELSWDWYRTERI
jgi:hypothetical protein